MDVALDPCLPERKGAAMRCDEMRCAASGRRCCMRWSRRAREETRKGRFALLSLHVEGTCTSPKRWSSEADAP